jgi:hypothetical protein
MLQIFGSKKGEVFTLAVGKVDLCGCVFGAKGLNMLDYFNQVLASSA